MSGKCEGWYCLSNAPKWHYFVDGRSLCGKWMTFENDPNAFEQGKNDLPSNCAACRKKLLKRMETA
jgi:hypothetical protein